MLGFAPRVFLTKEVKSPDVFTSFSLGQKRTKRPRVPAEHKK